MENLSWLNEIEFEDLLTGDLELVYKYCGKDVLIALWAGMPSIPIYLSTKPLEEARKRYLRKHFNGSNLKALAVKLGMSESQAYNVIRADNAKNNNRAMKTTANAGGEKAR
jgi:Mor family transcriptional regulator